MKKTLFTFLILVPAVRHSFSQVYNNPGGTIITSAGTFFDTGGSGNDYSNGDTIITTFCSSAPDSCIQFSFTSFNIEPNRDYLSIYDGPSAASGLMGTYNFISSPGVITSSSGCLTFKFISDSSTTRSGWEAAITCVSTCAPPVIIPGSIVSVCSGYFYDSGGGLGSLHKYGNNENAVTTICSAIPDSCLRVTFTSFNLQLNEDYLSIYDGPSTASGLIGTYNFISSPGVVTSSSGCLTFKFTSDSANTNTGWAATISCTSGCAPPVMANPGGTTSLCAGTFYDSGGGSGPSHNYGNNENTVTTLCSGQPADQIQVAFTSFSIELNKDFMRIYDGPDTSSALVGSYTFIGSPGTVTSTSGCLTFHFTSDSLTTKPGWAATISCQSAVNTEEVLKDSYERELVLFDVPVASELNGEVILNETGPVVVELMDMYGRPLRSETIFMENGKKSFKISMNAMAGGVYLVSAKSGVYTIRKLFVKM